MPAPRLTIAIPKPCPKPWDDMTPHGQGRFCQSCQKTVVDFTNMSEAEVVDWLSRQQGRTCGIFHKDQLNQGSLPSRHVSFGWIWKAAMMALATWMSTEPTQATAIPTYEIPTTSTSTVRHQSVFTEIPLSDSVSVARGKVIDATTGEELPGVSVYLKGTTIMAAADRNGVFALGLPAHLNIEKQVVVVYFIGYKAEEILLKDLLEHPMRTIRLTSDARWIGEVVVMKWYSPRSLYYRVKNLFR